MRAGQALLETEDTSNGPWLTALSLLAVISIAGSADAADKPAAEPSAAQRIIQLPSRLPGLFRRDTASGSDPKASPPPTQTAPSQTATVSAPAAAIQDPGLQRAREMLIEARLRETRGDLAGALDLAERAEQVRLGAERTRGARWPASEPAPRDYIARLEARMVARSTAATADKSGAAAVPLNQASRSSSDSASVSKPVGPAVAGPAAASPEISAAKTAQIPAQTAQVLSQLPVAELFGLNDADSSVAAAAASLEPRFDGVDLAAVSLSAALPSVAQAEPLPTKGVPVHTDPDSVASFLIPASGTGPEPEPASPILTRKTLEEQLASRMSGAIAGRSSIGRQATQADSLLASSIGVFSPVTSATSPSPASDLLAPSLTARQAASAAGAIVQIAAPIAQQVIPEKSAEQLKKVSEQSRAVIETAKTIHQVAQDTGVIQAGGPEAEAAGQSGPAGKIPGVLMDSLEKLESWIPGSQPQSGSTAEPVPQVDHSTQPPLAIPDLLDNRRHINDQEVSPIPTHMIPGRTSSSAKAIDINPGQIVSEAIDGSGRAEAPLLLHPDSTAGADTTASSAVGGFSLFKLFLIQISGTFAGTLLAVGACLLIRQRLRKSGQTAVPLQPATPVRTTEESTADVVPFPGTAEPRSVEKIGKAA